MEQCSKFLWTGMGRDLFHRLEEEMMRILIAGTGSRGNAGDGGPETGVAFNVQRGIAAGKDGSAYTADSLNDRIRHVSAEGVITNVAETGIER